MLLYFNVIFGLTKFLVNVGFTKKEFIKMLYGAGPKILCERAFWLAMLDDVEASNMMMATGISRS